MHCETAYLFAHPLSENSPSTGQRKVPRFADHISHNAIALWKPTAENLPQPIPGNAGAPDYLESTPDETWQP
jgi:hypothetical protein